MSQHSDHDPLLAFSIEPGTAPVAQPDPAPSVEPVVSPAVRTAEPAIPASADELIRLRARLDRLEKVFGQSARDVESLRSQVATLVGVARNITPRSRRASLPIVSAIGGVLLGIATGVWLWMSTGNEPVAPTAPIVASEPLSTPPAALVEALPRAAIVPAAVITPVSDAPARAPVRTPPARGAYVGTLSIDADPDGAVFIDRVAAGKTPLRAENLRAGSHLVWIERDGYRRFTRVVLVPADRVTRVVADLEPAQR